jgi:hypothetical protein
MSRFTLDRLSDPTVVAVRCAGEDWPRGLLSETPIPDTWMGLVITADGRRRFVPAGEDPKPQRGDTLLLVRNRAVTVPLAAERLPAADDHAIAVEAELLLRWVARDDDLHALYQSLLSDAELTLASLGEAVARAGAPAALRSFVRQHPAEHLTQSDQRDALLQHVRDELKRFLFSAGCEIERVGRVTFASRTLTEQRAIEQQAARRVQEMEARQRMEQAALAATHRRLDALGGMLDKLKTAAAEDGTMQWRELLPALAPSERGRLLESLWRLTPNRRIAAAIIVVAGRECAWLDPNDPEQVTQRVTLPDDLGGLRSVAYAADGDTLLIGAAQGIWQVDPAGGEIRGQFTVPIDEPPRTGFNAAVADATHLYATHSQLGAWQWDLAEPDAPRALLQPADGRPQTIRAITRDDAGRILLATDDEVRAFSADGEPLWQSGPTLGSIHCLAPLEDRLYAGTSRGALLAIDLAQPEDCEVVHRAAGAIESIAARRWDDLTELVIPAGPQGVVGIFAEEGIVSRLLDVREAVRRAWACDDILIALNSHRDTLTVLNGSMPERTGRAIPLGRTLGHSIQDACIVTRAGAAETDNQPESTT